MTVDDALLVALIDDELDEEAKRRLLAQLAADEGLRQRYEALREAGRHISTSFDALLGNAPLSRLSAALPSEDVARPASLLRPKIAGRELAAGFVAGLVAAGAAAWIALGLAGPASDWRSAVVQYVNLYTNETFSPLKPDASLEALELAAVGARVGAKLTPDDVALPGLRFTVAFMLAFDGWPLGAIAFVDPQGSPVLLCITANGEADSSLRLEKREGLSLATWSRDGRGYLVIGRQPESRIAEFAGLLEKQI
jgi:anti-sigma factor RsiW